jgi:hypothetical protein
MTTPSVSNASASRPSAHVRQKAITSSMPAHRAKWGSTGNPQRFSCSSVSAWLRL